MKRSRLLLLAGIVVLVALFFLFDGQRYLSFEFLQAQRSALVALRDTSPWLSALAFAGLYIAVTALSLPGALILTLAAGAIFGLAVGVVVASFASSIGATLAFLLARHLFRNVVQARFANALEPINRGVTEDGAFYLFALRLVPAFPYFVINVVMALTPMRLWTFFWVTQVGMLAATVVFVNAGREIGALQSLSGILSPTLLLSFALLGIFPLVARKALGYWSKRRKQTA